MNFQRILQYIFCFALLTACSSNDNPSSPVMPATPTSSTSAITTQATDGDDVDPDLEAVIADAPSLKYNVEDLALYGDQTIGQFYKEHPEVKAADEAELKQEIKNFSGRKAVVLDNVEDLSSPLARLKSMRRRLTLKADLYCHILDYGWKPQEISDQKPDQPYGLAYVYNGGRNVEPSQQRETPSSKCPDVLLYGADCSGFVYRAFKNAGFLLTPTNTKGFNELSYWNKVIEGNPDKLKDLQVNYVSGVGQTSNTRHLFSILDAALLNPNFYAPGDIIFWHKASGEPSHMGIVLYDTKTKSPQIFQSNGILSAGQTKGKVCTGGTATIDDCKSNYLCPSRGVHAKALTFIQQLKGTPSIENPDPIKYISIIRFSTNDEYLSYKIDGQSANYVGLNLGIVGYSGKIYPTNQNQLVIVFGNAERGINFTITGFKNPGVFTSDQNNTVTVSYSENSKYWKTVVKATVTITSFTADAIDGTFEFIIDPGVGNDISAQPGIGRKNITNGIFHSKYRIIQ